MIRKLPVILILFIFGIGFPAGAVSMLFNSDNDKIIITSSDQKKLEKAEKAEQKSKQIMQEADKIYSEISAKQSELTVEETEKLNYKALDKQIEGLKLLQSSNKIKYEVYISKADEFWKNYKGNPEDLGYAKSLESSSRINFQSATDQFKEAEGNSDKLIVFSTMSSASELSKTAVGDITKAFNIYTNTSLSQIGVPQNAVQTSQISSADTVHLVSDTVKIPPVEITPKPSNKVTSSSNIYQAINIKEDMIDRFNKFIKESYPEDYEKYIINFSQIDYSDIEAIKAAWYNYYFGENYPKNEVLVSDSAKKITSDSLLLAQRDTSLVSKGTELAETTGKETKIKPKIKAKGRKLRRSAQDYLTEETSDSISKTKERKLRRSVQDYLSQEPSDDIIVKGFTYRVQIVASRVPLNSEMLKDIYAGHESIEEVLEDEWYKYSIGPYQTYASARQFRESCEIKGAFVVAFVNGRKINPLEALVTPEHNSENFVNFNYSSSLTFKVQVAACRDEIQDDELRKIYAGPEQIESSFEDNWHKYSVNCGNDYKKACDLLKNINVAGAFITVYNNGEHVNLRNIFSEN